MVFSVLVAVTANGLLYAIASQADIIVVYSRVVPVIMAEAHDNSLLNSWVERKPVNWIFSVSYFLSSGACFQLPVI